MKFLAVFFLSILNVALGIYSLSNYFRYLAEGETALAVLNAVLFVLNIGVGIFNLVQLAKFVKRVFEDE